MATPNQIGLIHKLAKKAGLDDQERKALIREHTGGRTDSSKDLTWQEVQDIVKALSPGGSKAISADDMRKKILYYAHQIGWELPGGKIDMKRVNAWCENSGKFKKALNNHSYYELVELVSQMEIVYNKFLDKI
jgi:hypothetical protein